jgi:cell wall-associated NlpC family hydrolase
MNEQEKRDWVLWLAKQYYGLWYKWGGDDPAGFDCSGLVIECLKSIGILPRQGDWTAQDLWYRFPISPANPKPGDLVFYNNAKTVKKIIHVEICLNDELSIGASGGGKFIKTEQDAKKYNAFIKVRPFGSRDKLRGFKNPYL